MEPRELFMSAAAAYVEQVRGIPSTAWDGPGLGDWDLRALVGHACRSLTTVVDYATRTADAVEVESAADYFVRASQVPEDQRVAIFQRGVAAGEALGGAPVASVEQASAAARKTLDATPPDRVVVTAMGAMRFEEYLRTRSFELVVHGLDIARAVRSEDLPPAEAVTDALLVAAGAAAASGRGVPLLLAITGRGELPQGFSVV